MSLDDMAEERSSADRVMEDPEAWRVSDLMELFGREATRRGVEYMVSLVEADQEYRQSANPDDLDEGWARGYGVEDKDLDTEASDKWAEMMEEKGLGLDE
jgi:hypothetical protein